MSSIRRVQAERLLEDIIHTLYAQGIKPTFSEISSHVSKYFQVYPSGKPLPLPLRDAIASGTTDVEEFNKLMTFLAINLDVLYETSLRQVDEVLELTTSLQTHLQRLSNHRDRVESDIDDYLLSLYNTDGFLYSVSDNFADTYRVDLAKTTAEIDTQAKVVVLSNNSGTSSSLQPGEVGAPTFFVSPKLPYTSNGDFTSATETSLENVVWSLQVSSPKAQDVSLNAVFDVSKTGPIDISAIEVVPHGITPVKIDADIRVDNGTWQNYSQTIGYQKNKFILSSGNKKASVIRLKFYKQEPDYIEEVNGRFVYKYIFGAKSISIHNRIYESTGRLVSSPIVIPEELEGDLLIDAVSLETEAETPLDTDIRYYVAPTTGTEEDFSELNWQEIVPIGSDKSGDTIARFDGVIRNTVKITNSPRQNDLVPIPIGNAANPNDTIIAGVDIYRLARFNESYLEGSLSLIEGNETVKIHSKQIDEDTDFELVDLPYWAEIFSDPNQSLDIDYGDIDNSRVFFYGGDIGTTGKDVFIETYIDADRTYPSFLTEMRKLDSRAATWDVKLFLNGKPIGQALAGTNAIQIPWNLQKGLNHLVMLVRIPTTEEETNSFLGSISVMPDSLLSDYGQVYLAKWHYTDIFEMQYNEAGQPKTFTVHGGEIISRRKPTINYVFSYAKPSGSAPLAIRVRADLQRSTTDPAVTPKLKKYRVRFAYTE